MKQGIIKFVAKVISNIDQTGWQANLVFIAGAPWGVRDRLLYW